MDIDEWNDLLRGSGGRPVLIIFLRK
jgi:hypothetical protein